MLESFVNGVIKMSAIFRRCNVRKSGVNDELIKMLMYLRLSGNEKRDINQRREDWKYGIMHNAIRAREIEEKVMHNLLMQESVKQQMAKTKKSKRGPLMEHLEKLERKYELFMKEYTAYKGEELRLRAKLASSCS